MIELGKEYKTRDGREVVILATNGRGKYPIIGQILNKNGEWELHTWTADGFAYSNCSLSLGDLIEVNPVLVVDGWLNTYKDIMPVFHLTRRSADEQASPGRIACLHIRHEYHEGDGL
jgi:hypothetical protein